MRAVPGLTIASAAAEPDEGKLEARRREDRQDAEAFRLLFYTGLRLGQMLTLRWGGADLDGRLLFVRRGASAGEETLPKGASGFALPQSERQSPAR